MYVTCKTAKQFYIQQIEKRYYHHSYYKILGKYHVDDVRHKEFDSKPGDISTRSYYAKRFSFEPDGKLQNEFFDNNRTLSMEVCCLYRFRKIVSVSNFYDNGGMYVNRSDKTVREFHLN